MTTSAVKAAVNAGPARTRITGHFLQIGGPAPGGQVHPVASTVSAYTNPQGSGPAAAVARSDRNGLFTLVVDPGTYYLAGVDPRVIGPGGKATVIRSQAPVKATLGRVVTADLRAFVP